MVKEDGWYLLVREGRWKYPMNQRSLSEIVAGPGKKKRLCAKDIEGSREF